MPAIHLETLIAATTERCFDLARSVEAHVATSRFTKEKAVAPGRLSGLLELHDVVTFEAIHLGVRQRLTACITEFQRPVCFVDEQVSGAFRKLRHVHEFSEVDGGTLMIDTILWISPLGLLGVMADRLFLKRYLMSFLRRKQALLKDLAETEGRV